MISHLHCWLFDRGMIIYVFSIYRLRSTKLHGRVGRGGSVQCWIQCDHVTSSCHNNATTPVKLLYDHVHHTQHIGDYDGVVWLGRCKKYYICVLQACSLRIIRHVNANTKSTLASPHCWPCVLFCCHSVTCCRKRPWGRSPGLVCSFFHLQFIRVHNFTLCLSRFVALCRQMVYNGNRSDLCGHTDQFCDYVLARIGRVRCARAPMADDDHACAARRDSSSSQLFCLAWGWRDLVWKLVMRSTVQHRCSKIVDWNCRQRHRWSAKKAGNTVANARTWIRC